MIIDQSVRLYSGKKLQRKVIEHMFSKYFIKFIVFLMFPGLFISQQVLAESEQFDQEATKVVQQAVEHMRDESSRGRSTMRINRPGWSREMTFESWTQGMDKSLVRFVAPARDAGSASLKVGNEMWSYSPRVRRVIRIPASMMTQSWMGSDFSYNDLARDDEIVQSYNHRFLESEEHEGQHVHVVEAVPKEHAPVVWGREVVRIREDNVLLEHLFYDQGDDLLKKLETLEIDMVGDRMIPVRMRMSNLEKPDEWTEIEQEAIEFGVNIPAHTFTQAHLRDPR